MFREFYYVLMTHYPNTAHEAFNEKYRDIKWEYNKEIIKVGVKGVLVFQ